MTNSRKAQHWLDVAEAFESDDYQFTCNILRKKRHNKKLSCRAETMLLQDFWNTHDLESVEEIPAAWDNNPAMNRNYRLSNTTRMLYALSLAYLNDPHSLDAYS